MSITQITITVDSQANARWLTRMLMAMPFIKNVENDEIKAMSSDVIALLEERMEEYRKNPKAGENLHLVKKDVKKKYGF